MPYTKRAVQYVADGVPHVDCECGHAINLPVIKGLPMTYVCGNCGIEYDSRGWILNRPSVSK